MKHRSLLGSFALMLIVVIASQSKLSAQDKPDVKTKSAGQKALNLLEETLTDTQSLKVAENQIYLDALAATALWKQDEKRARAMFAQVTKRLAQAIGENDPTLRQTLTWIRSNIRTEVAYTLATLDAALAREFIAATRPAKDPNNSYSDPNISSPAVVINNPQDPRQLSQAIESRLAKGIDYDYFPLLKRLRKADPEAANRAVQLLMDKLRTDEAANKFVERSALCSSVGYYLLDQEMETDEFINLRPATSKQSANSILTNSVLGESARREVLAIFTRTAITIAPYLSSDNSEKYHQAQELLTRLFVYQPEIKKYWPAMAEKLQPLLTELQSILPAHSREGIEFRYLRRYGTVGEMIDATRKSRQPFLDNYYGFIARRLIVEGGDFQPLQQLINDQIPETGKRQSTMDSVWSNVAYAFAQQGRLDLVMHLLNRIDSDVTRAGTTTSIAFRLLDDGDTDNAAKLVDKASSLLSLPVETNQQNQAINGLMRCNSRLDPARNFVWLEGLAPQLNELSQAYVLLGGWDSYNQLYAKDGEIGIPGYSAQSVTTPIKHLASLARIDFDRAKSIAEGFTQTEVRLFAQIMVARGVLNPEMGGAW